MESEPEFISNTPVHNFYNSLIEHLSGCTEFKISVAFITYGGLQVLLDTLQELCNRNIPGEVLTTTYKEMTTPQVLKRLSEFSNIKVKIFVPPVNGHGSEEYGFHAKGYIFGNGSSDDAPYGRWTVIIGSSNITGRALKTNIEWNVLQDEKCGENQEPGAYTKSVLEEFETLWQSKWAKEYSEQFLISYRDYLNKIKRSQKAAPKQAAFTYNDDKVIQPNAMQQEAIVKLDRLRKAGARKALAIAATGSGKTYMSVFDALQVKPKHLLFIVHREDILHKAKESFDKVCSLTEDDYSSGFFTGSRKDKDVKYLFATRDSLSRHYAEFAPDAFDYIVLDEAHHASSPSYKDILGYFKPTFLLGLTATPERSDQGDIYSVFDNNVAVEIRLRQALEFDLVCPFHYFGLTDAEGIDYSRITAEPGTSEYVEAIAKMLMVSRRVDYIIDKMNFYGHDGDKLKCLGFCQTIEHAEYMAAEFNKHGIESVALSGSNDVEVREKYASRLEDDDDALQVIFSVDIFNEGIDIPTVNEVLLLRPTDSSIIFIQQIGRGLRKLPQKEFVTVLDFIGNYKKSFLIALALNGRQNYDKDSTKVQVMNDFGDLPNGTYIKMSEITKQQILTQLENEKFMSMKYMKEEYLSFKNTVNGGHVPFLCDYLKHDGAVDPVQFIKAEAKFKSYLDFTAYIENDTHPELSVILQNSPFRSLMNLLSFYCPAKRCEEFTIVRTILNSQDYSSDLGEIENLTAKYLKTVSKERILHACQVLSGKYFDSSEMKVYKDGLLISDSSRISFNKTVINELNSSEEMKEWLSDLVDYSLLRYSFEFGSDDYSIDASDMQIPFLKPYHEYSMRSLAILSNYAKLHSAFRGNGLVNLIKPDYLLFVDLYKTRGVKENQNYQDYFITPETFHWESPNTTTQSSETGQDLIHNIERHARLHLFVRKYKNIDGKIQPFIYLGEAVTHPDSAKGNKPIEMIFTIPRLPDDLYTDFTTRTDTADKNSSIL